MVRVVLLLILAALIVIAVVIGVIHLLRAYHRYIHEERELHRRPPRRNMRN